MYDYNCDVKLKVGQETFRAHRDVLGEASDYFSAMFGLNMREKEQDVIEMLEISPRGFTAMMEYFYHGHVTVDPDNIEDVLEAARFFHIEWLVHICCDFLIRFLSLENYHIVLHLVDKYCLGDLRPGIFSFVSQNFMTLAEQPKFTQLSYDLLYLLLSEDHYIDASEGFILEAVLRWLQHDPAREEHREALLCLIRFPLVEPQVLERVPAEEVASVEALVAEGRAYHARPTRQCLLDSERASVRGARQVLGLYSAIYDAQHVHYKVPSLEGFFTEAIDTSFMENHFEFASVAVLGNFLFVAGGYGRHSWCSSPALYSYNPRNRLWAQLSSMQMPRVSFCLVPGKDCLFAVAGIEHVVSEGMDRENILDAVERYDPEENLWHAITPLPFGCFDCGAAVAEDGQLYVSGGITSDPEDNVPVNYVHACRLEEGAWHRRARMLTERHCHAMLAHAGRLFVFGGYTTGPDTMSFDICRQNESYDLETDQWTLLRETPPSFERIYSSATVLDGVIYLLGGSGAERFVHRYNSEENQFEETEQCPGQHVQRMVNLQVAFPADIM